ncbi:radical SAM protein, partial [Streptomyces sp. RP5T]|uniref:radical SAM protein n=2 Tax=unclassified Streptomyces TaxID=2593676 RepID=UPI000F648FFD
MDPSPHPLSQFVLKMHSRCDLACDHCYVFEHADQSWRGKPVVISDELLDLTARRIAEHARTHRLDTVHVVLHGGEPLLAGRNRLRRAAQSLSTALSGVSALDLRIHTNGVTLDEQFCELFAEYDIKVGVSLDGDRAANDLHRRYRNGRSSHIRVLRAIELLRGPRYRHLFAGLLCTVDLRNDPVTVYDALAELAPPR